MSVLADLGRADPATVCFLTGAGVSMSPPTSLPSGFRLTEDVCSWAFLPGTLDEIRELYGRLDIARTLPRLEVVLGVASSNEAHGIGALNSLLSPIRNAPPNPIHGFFADHLRHGGRHITANFDTCIERARTAAFDAPIHFHGAIDDPPESLGATFRNIENGLPEETAKQLAGALAEVDWLVIAGYSGSDVFDIAPWLQSFEQSPGSLQHLRVVWVDHASGQLAVVSFDEPTPPSLTSLPDDVAEFLDEERRDWAWEQRASMRAAGADVHLVRGDTGELFDRLAAAWGIPLTALAHKPVVAASSTAPDRDNVTRATALLWAALGYQRRCLEIAEAHPDLFTPEFLSEQRAARAWQLGQYRSARRIWAESRPRQSEQERARWVERQIACRWVSGSYIRAAVLAERSWRRQRAHAISNPEMLEVWARCLDHMRRSPDLRWFYRWKRSLVLGAVDEAIAAEVPGQHIRTGLSSARARMTASTRSGGEQQTDARARFLESESMTGVLNYRHGRAHDRSDLDRVFFDRIAGWHQEIGCAADAARVPVLPGATRSYTMRVQWASLRPVEFTRWHRLRLFVRAQVHRLRPRSPDGGTVP